MDTDDLPTTAELNAELDPDVDPRASSTPQVAVVVRVLAATRFVPLVLTADEAAWPGELSAHLYLDRPYGDIDLAFNYGWAKPDSALASIDNLSRALAALRHLVSQAAALEEPRDPNPIDDTPPGSDDDSEPADVDEHDSVPV